MPRPQPPPQVMHAEVINLPPGISPDHSKLFHSQREIWKNCLNK